MLRLLADENFNGDLVRGLLLRDSRIDIVRAQDVGLLGTQDAEVLAWAAVRDRIVLTHDRATMPYFAFERIAAGDFVAGVLVLNDRRPLRDSIDEILLLIECSEQHEWHGRVVQLPL
jgi:hypothetical protein